MSNVPTVQLYSAVCLPSSAWHCTAVQLLHTGRTQTDRHRATTDTNNNKELLAITDTILAVTELQ